MEFPWYGPKGAQKHIELFGAKRVSLPSEVSDEFVLYAGELSDEYFCYPVDLMRLRIDSAELGSSDRIDLPYSGFVDTFTFVDGLAYREKKMFDGVFRGLESSGLYLPSKTLSRTLSLLAGEHDETASAGTDPHHPRTLDELFPHGLRLS